MKTLAKICIFLFIVGCGEITYSAAKDIAYPSMMVELTSAAVNGGQVQAGGARIAEQSLYAARLLLLGTYLIVAFVIFCQGKTHENKSNPA